MLRAKSLGVLGITGPMARFFWTPSSDSEHCRKIRIKFCKKHLFFQVLTSRSIWLHMDFNQNLRGEFTFMATKRSTRDECLSFETTSDEDRLRYQINQIYWKEPNSFQTMRYRFVFKSVFLFIISENIFATTIRYNSNNIAYNAPALII